MEVSDPATPDTSIDIESTANHRKSARAKQKPVLLNKDPNIPQNSYAGGKRKRVETRDIDVEDLGDEEEESSQGESDPDEEELKEQRRKAARSKRGPSKPNAKKAKTANGLTTNLAVRSLPNGVKKTTRAKQARPRPLKDAVDAGTGLYGMYCA